MAGSVSGIAVGGASLYVSWLGYRAERREHADSRSLAAVADELALAVRDQWEAELRTRRIDDPYPLAVSWEPVDDSLVQPWQLLVDLAERAGQARGDGSGGPAALAGTEPPPSRASCSRPCMRRSYARTAPCITGLSAMSRRSYRFFSRAGASCARSPR